jgi:hypothetical protein
MNDTVFTVWTFSSQIVILGTCVVLIAVGSRRVKIASITLPLVLGFTAGLLVFGARMLLSPELNTDEVTWSRLALDAREWILGSEGSQVHTVEGKAGYVWILGVFHVFVGPAPELARSLNLPIALLTVVAVARTTELIVIHVGLDPGSISRAIKATAYFAALSPTVLYWEPWVLRETITRLFLSVVVLFFIKGVVGEGVRFWWFAGFFVCLIYWLRATLGVAVLVALIGSWCIVEARQAHQRTFATGVAITVFALIATGSKVALEVLFGKDSRALVDSVHSLSAEATSGFVGTGQSEGGITELILVTGPRVLVGPFPWEWQLNASMALSVVDGWVWAVTVLLALRGTRRVVAGPTRKAVFWALWVFASVLLVTFMVSLGNYGILARMRPLAWAVLVPLAGMGINTRRSTRRAARTLRSAKRVQVSTRIWDDKALVHGTEQ